MNRATIAAIATPPGMGAVALLRLSGADAFAIAARVFSGRSQALWEPRRQHFGRIVAPDGSVIDEVLLTSFPGPGSFTGEDVVEIACHGGVIVTNEILGVLLSAGAEPAGPGEFSERAFLNGKIDLTRAEAIMDLISARTDLAMKAAGEQLSGRLGAEIERIRLDFIGLLAHLEAYIDFPEEDIDPDSSSELQARAAGVLAKLEKLLATADQGRILREGIRTVICGAPNAGKSSLLNRLLGFDRAIVNDVAGTTRDTIEELINLRGIPLRLVDTAGLREGLEAVEREGIERSRAQIAAAELILLVVDSSSAPDQVDEVEKIDFPPHAKVVRLLNKSDLTTHPDRIADEGFPVSCLDDSSIAALRDHIYDRITAATTLGAGELVSINARHQHCLNRAKGDLVKAIGMMAAGLSPEFVAMDLRAALDAVGDVVGRTDIEEILGEIFSQFCIGK
ncbi:MAG: tRNA uridine-5-carboxymethylaminomethyl(34) synthesis GTPase MnmE [Verrucomicrobiales bacterium]|nr:tRNA uridine-5-carboxymethylaminomethyl(34) synthesis GTPase MnmE [Verrucomicrobiales bacterium]MDP4792321.1 tRNA uridine-5-carboxymethylaminomethyl(34) synthesis GTPase MnmE [Verrucomicrobiales bacterium]MDP4939478.1 tRNA uridine-5-carboxymethylaminomethyl(34) synthesis GTPase MnmE [Verrucomicrobiales bacterium]